MFAQRSRKIWTSAQEEIFRWERAEWFPISKTLIADLHTLSWDKTVQNNAIARKTLSLEESRSATEGPHD